MMPPSPPSMTGTMEFSSLPSERIASSTVRILVSLNTYYRKCMAWLWMLGNLDYWWGWEHCNMVLADLRFKWSCQIDIHLRNSTHSLGLHYRHRWYNILLHTKNRSFFWWCLVLRGHGNPKAGSHSSFFDRFLGSSWGFWSGGYMAGIGI